MEEKNEKENKKAILENKTRDVEKKLSTISEHEHKVDVINIIMKNLTTKRDLILKQQELQMNNFGFTENFKPIEKFQTMPVYMEIVKGLQTLQNEETILRLDEDIYAQKRFKLNAIKDLESAKESLTNLNEQIEKLKKELEE